MSLARALTRGNGSDQGRHDRFAEPSPALVHTTGNVGLDILADAIAARVAAYLCQSQVPRLMTVNEGAVYIGRTPKALRHMIASRAIPVVRDGARIHLDRSDLDHWIEMRKTKS